MVFGVLHTKAITTWKHRLNFQSNFSRETNFRDIQNQNAILVNSSNLSSLALPS